MAAELHFLDQRRLIDTNGIADGAEIHFYQTGTLTPASIYSDEDLATPLANPVVVASGAALPDIYLDGDVTYRRKIVYPDGSVDDTDPYIAPSSSGLSFINVGASATRRTVQSRLRDSISIADYGASDSASAATNISAIAAAVTAAVAAGHGNIHVPPLNYAVTPFTISSDDVHLDARGAIFTSAHTNSAAMLSISGDRVTIEGATLYLTSDSGAPYNLDVSGEDFALTNVTLDGAAISGAGGIHGFIRNGADRFHMIGCKLFNRNGIQVEGNDGLYLGCRLESGGGGDDAFAIKAISGNTSNNRFVGCHFNGHTAFLSIGTQVGTPNANDSSYTKGVYNTVMDGCTGENCASIVLLKVGTSQATDYRDGTIDGVTVTGCSLNDSAGSKARALAWLTAARGGRIRNVTVSDCTVRMRAPDQTQINAGILVQGYDYTGGTAAARIENIFINGCKVIDVYDGVVNNVSTAPGYPIDCGFYIEQITGSGGSSPVIGRFELNNFYLNGCTRQAVNIGSASLTGPFKINGAVLKNFANNASASGVQRAAINVLSPITVRNIETAAGSAAPAGTRAVMGDSPTDATIEIASESRQVRIGSVTAGNLFTDTIFRAKRDTWISKIEIVTSATVTQSDTNYTTITVTNQSTAGNLVSKNTKVTGGLAITAWTPTSMNGTTQFSGANAYLPKGGVLSAVNGNTGTGTALTGLSFIVHYAEYGS